MARRLRLRPTSRYKGTRLYFAGRSTTFFGSWNPPQIETDDIQDTRYRTKEGDRGRLDLVAFKFYDDPALWWVIAQANDITDPMSLEVGTLLRIPARRVIDPILSAPNFPRPTNA